MNTKSQFAIRFGVFTANRENGGGDLSNQYQRNFCPDRNASQGGEDGIIQEIFRRLSVSRGTFVEFGAWDGILFSNTYALVKKGWDGLYIEGDPKKFKKLRRNMAAYSRIRTLCRYVGCEGQGRLDHILAQADIPKDFDFLSIDIDGNDYWIFQSLTQFHPRVIVVEYNANFGPAESKSIPYNPRHQWDGTMFFGASAAALYQLARAKGYTPVAYTRLVNLFFVRNDLVSGRFEPLAIEKVPIGPVHIQKRRAEFIDV